MTLILDLPRDVDERLQRDAERKGVPKESLAVDIIARSVGVSAADFWTPASLETLVRERGVKPVGDFEQWLASMPTVEGADELVERIAESRRERRELERSMS